MSSDVCKDAAGQEARPHDADVAAMFDRISPCYDFLNRLLSLGADQCWRRQLASHVRPGKGNVVLDLAAGTLDVALAVHKYYPGATVLAMDFCHSMLEQGRGKLKGSKAQAIVPMAADAKKLPLAKASVDCITMAFGIRNIVPREAAFKEMLRVLRPGGRVCILEFGSGQEKIWGGLYNFYLDTILPQVGRLFSQDGKAYSYLAETIDAFPTAKALEEELCAAGFARAWHHKLTSGIACLHLAEKAG